MSATPLHCTTATRRLVLRTPTGWSFSGAIGPIRDSRGRRVASRFHTRRLSGNAVEFWQTIRSARSGPCAVTDLRMFDGMLRLEGDEWRMAHHELYKRERYFGGYSVATGGLFAPVPGTEGDFGMSEDWPFPGLFFTHPERGTVLIATLSQERCKPHWSLRRRGRHSRLIASERFSGVPSIRVGAGQEVGTERWVALFTRSGLEDAVEQFYRFLRRRISFFGANSIVRRAVLWGTWNYNYRPRSFCDITHDMVAANARALAKLARGKPHFVMIDDGYQRGCSRRAGMKDWFSSCLEIFHDDGTPPHDPRLFPRGMKGMAEAIRKAGSRPVLWATIRIHKESALAKARPEWILKTTSPKGFGVRSAYLDYSIPEVREYTREAWRTIFRKWGYEGLKLDFWSMPFEVPEVRYRNRDRTAVELRNLFLQDLREFVPKGGFVLVAVVTNGGGNPFVGRYADAARMGMDIGDGSFAEVRQSANCLTVASPFYRHDCLLGDPDSFGWCVKNTAGQNRLWATMTLLSGGVCEIGGDLTRPSREARQLLQTAVRFFRPSRRTANGIASGRINVLPSDHLVLERDDGVYEGWLNWTIFPRAVRLPFPVRDLWTGRTLRGTWEIPPGDAILFRSRRSARPVGARGPARRG